MATPRKTKGAKGAKAKARRESGSMLSASELRAIQLKQLRKESGAAVSKREMKAITRKKGAKRKR